MAIWYQDKTRIAINYEVLQINQVFIDNLLQSPRVVHYIEHSGLGHSSYVIEMPRPINDVEAKIIKAIYEIAGWTEVEVQPCRKVPKTNGVINLRI